MKVCHIISAFYRNDTRIFWKQCQSLVNAGYEVTLIANDDGIYETRNGVTIIPSGYNNAHRFKRLFFSGRKIYKIALELNADVYQIHDPEFLPLGLKLKRAGKYIVYDCHEDFPRQILEKHWIPFIFKKILSWSAEAYQNKILKKYDAITTVTPHFVDLLEKIGGNVHLVTNFPLIESDFIPFSSEEYLSRENKMVYAGTVYITSLQENVISALDGVENINYVMVGAILENYLLRLSGLPSWPKVKFMKRVVKDELLKIYRSATIGIVIFDYTPNVGYKKGTLGNNKIFEYMHAALPVICTDFELWKEIIDKYKCGIYVNPHSIDQIRDAIKFLTENKEEAYKMGQNGRQAILNEYNWNGQRKVYLKVFDDISEKMISSKSL